MVRPEVIPQLRASITSEGLGKPDWVLALDDVDEPPLFSRTDQVRFLDRLPSDERGTILLALALEHLCSISELLSSIDRPTRRYFACVTLSDFDEVLAGAQSVATIAIQVDPNDQKRMQRVEFRGAQSRDALTVESWLRSVGEDAASKYMVAELPGTPAPAGRVYVGFRQSPCRSLRSIGDYSMQDSTKANSTIRPGTRT